MSLEQDPDSPIRLPPVQSAAEAFLAGKRGRALSLLAQALQANPQDVQAWLWMAVAHPEADKKRFSLEKALGLQPDNPLAGEALRQLNSGRPDAAQAAEDLLVSELTVPEPPPVILTAAAAVPDSPAEMEAVYSPTPAQPDRPAPRRFSCLQNCILLLLLLLLFLIFGLLGAVIFAPELVPVPLAMQLGLPIPDTPGPALPQDTPTPFQFPPTWTPTITVPPQPTATPFIPTPTPVVPTNTPLPTLTPLSAERRLIIGRSEGDQPIEIVRFGMGSDQRLIVSGVHSANEPDALALAEEMIIYLKDNPEVVPEGVTIYILRSLNPDGETMGAPDGRLNANGVDLDRNFSLGWKEAPDTTGCPQPAGTPGSAALSEAATQALAVFLTTREIRILVELGGEQLGVFPGGQPGQNGESNRLGRALSEVTMIPFNPESGCQRTGALIDWATANDVYGAVNVQIGQPATLDERARQRILELVLGWEPRPPATLPPATYTPVGTSSGTATGTPGPSSTSGVPSLTPITPAATTTP